MKKLLFLIAAGLLLIAGCKKETIEDPIASNRPASVATCEGCHTNYQHLKAVYSPDTSHAGGGCGGETPVIDPYDRVYMGGEGYVDFKKSTHGRMACTDCHNGNGNTDDKKTAHSGDFLRHPSTQAQLKCTPCHTDIVNRAANSLHEQGWGQKAMVAGRFGVKDFNNLPEELKHGYNVNCAKCHGTCGDCHINRPVAGGGGLYKGHKFSKKPDMVDNCITCHVSRGGHAYLGIAPGTQPDIHFTKAGFTCTGCHTEYEIHGDGMTYATRFEKRGMPVCSNCHPNVVKSNPYHTQHIESFSCNTCHSQDYNNCGSCHVGGAGARVASYQGYKIGMNPLQGTRPFKWAILRRSLTAPDTWKEYGVPALANFDVAPTYKYTTPHNILRWTSRTQVAAGKACYDNCHIIKEGTTLRNKNLYLFRSDLESWEVNADKGIVVDGRLPASWGVTK